MGLQLVTPPALEPVIIDDVKAHLRILSDTEDELVSNYALAARLVMESNRYPGCGVALITQTWNLILDKFPANGLEFIEIPMAPVQTGSVSISYIDINGATTVWPSSNYIVDNVPPLGLACGPTRILPVTAGSFAGSWPTASLQPINAVIIPFKVGFGDTPDLVPIQLKIAMMMLAGTFYEVREATGDAGEVGVPIKVQQMLPFSYDALTGLYRQAGIA